MTRAPVLRSAPATCASEADPLRLLAESGLGWLAEHVDFLREPLGRPADHGDRFEEAVATWEQVATTLSGIARRRAGGWLTDEIAATARVCSRVAGHVAEARAITAAVQGVLRDVLAVYVAEVLDNAAVALAASEMTAGASVSDFAVWAVGRGAVVLERIGRRLADLLRVLARVLAALRVLFGRARDVLGVITRLGG
ncbi:hypothetical protein [Saccharothrix sp. HUAS TT1]|uniref:hypothetical protein n=1 Tax=unclassified Saccharothrix TaxID=2593673 RepID=UPI00345BC2BC